MHYVDKVMTIETAGLGAHELDILIFKSQNIFVFWSLIFNIKSENKFKYSVLIRLSKLLSLARNKVVKQIYPKHLAKKICAYTTYVMNENTFYLF